MVCGCCGQMQPMLLPCGYPPQLPTHFIYVPFGARSNSGQMTKASSCHTQGCLCWSPSRLHQHKLLLFLRLQQMGTSMNPNTMRKAREDVQCVCPRLVNFHHARSWEAGQLHQAVVPSGSN